VPTLVRDPNGREKCVSCQLCEFVCPPRAIRITPGEIPEDATTAHVEKAPRNSSSTCCVASTAGFARKSPGGGHRLQNVFTLNAESRDEVIFKKDKLYEMGGTLPDKHYKGTRKATTAWRAGSTEVTGDR
jgi:NADH-quinone oxidoreductase subunit I